MTITTIAVDKFDCPKCGAHPTQRCWDMTPGQTRENAHPHAERLLEARKAGY